MLTFDPINTRVLLIGVSEYSRDPEGLPDLPAVENNITELAKLFSDPELVGIPSSNIFLSLNQKDGVIKELMAKKAQEATDTLIFYYAGHGLIGKTDSNFILATSNTTSEQAEYNGIPFGIVKKAIQASGAKKKIIILDTCFSGRALGVMGPKSSILQESIDLKGTYAIASAPSNALAKALEGQKYTAFSGEFIRVLQEGIENGNETLTFREIFEHIKSELKLIPDVPEPQSANLLDADKMKFVQNMSYKKKFNYSSNILEELLNLSGDEQDELLNKLNDIVNKNKDTTFSRQNTLSNIFQIVQLMNNVNLETIVKDMEQGGEIISKSIYTWAKSCPEEENELILKIKGITLAYIIGSNGVLTKCFNNKMFNGMENRDVKLLLINPFSTNAILRSISENDAFIDYNKDQAKAICEHTLEKHKKCILYEDFNRSKKNIYQLKKSKISGDVRVDCKIYWSSSPNFLLINKETAIIENLLQGARRDRGSKLYGRLPHFKYGEGGIKDAIEDEFDYVWNYESIPIEEYHEEEQEKFYEINRMFLLYNLQNKIWDNIWQKRARSLDSTYDLLIDKYLEYFPNHQVKSILDLGCGDGGGGSTRLVDIFSGIEICFNDISHKALELLKDKIVNNKNNNLYYSNRDMLTTLKTEISENRKFSLIHANFSIIYMNNVKAVEVYKKIFHLLEPGGILMLSVWTSDYFNMPLGKHGVQGCRPDFIYTKIPIAEDLRVLIGGSDERIGEIRRFYKDHHELIKELSQADPDDVMNIKKTKYSYYENRAIIRLWVEKK